MDFNFSELKQDTHKAMGNPLDLNLGVDNKVKTAAAEPDHSPKEGSEGKKSTGSSLDDDWLVHVDDSKMTEQAADDFGDFMTTAKHNIAAAATDFGNAFNEKFDKAEKAGNNFMSDMTRDFMNAERGMFGSAPAPTQAAGEPADPIVSKVEIKPEPVPLIPEAVAPKPAAPIDQKPVVPSAPVHDDESDDDDDLPAMKKQDEQKSSGKFYDDFADNDSPSISYNPSPIKKNPVATALKEQENEKFISSEDLLGDFKDERTATPEFVQSNAAPQNPASSGLAEDVSDLLGNFKSTPAVAETKKPDPVPEPAAPEPIKPSPKVEEIKQKEVAPPPSLPKTAPPVPAHAPTSSVPPTVPVRKAPTPKQSPSSVGPTIVSVEEIFYKYGLDVWFKPERLHPRVESLIYWRDVKKSGIVFGAGLITLIAIAWFSVISVFAYLSILALSGTFSYRMYKVVMSAIQKTSEGHPFKEYLEFDLTISQERAQQVTSVAIAHVNGFTAELRRLFLVDDSVDSLKFGVILYFMTYIGAWFNGMTLVMLAFVSLFTLPKLYESNKQSIDSYLDLVRSKVTEITDKVKAAIPIGKKAPVESDKDK